MGKEVETRFVWLRSYFYHLEFSCWLPGHSCSSIYSRRWRSVLMQRRGGKSGWLRNMANGIDFDIVTFIRGFLARAYSQSSSIHATTRGRRASY